MAKGNDRQQVQKDIAAEKTRSQDQFTAYQIEQDKKRQEADTRSAQERAYLTQNLQSNVSSPANQDVINNLRALGRYPGQTAASGTNVSTGITDSGSGDTGGGGGTSEVTTNAVPPPDHFAEPYGYWKGIADSGGVDMGKLESSLLGYKKLADTGGFNPQQLASLNDTISGFKGIGSSGGFDSNSISNINSSLGNLRNLGQTGGFDAETMSRLYGDLSGLRGIGQSGGFDPEALSRIRGDISRTRGLADTGGYDPAVLQRERGRIDELSQLGRTGGMSDSDIARFRGTGFEEFSRTGGYNPEQVANMRARATSTVPALYDQQQQDINRMKSLSGGYSPGFLAATAKMSRGRGQALSDATRDAELGIQDQVRQGRMYGITGMRDTEASLQDILTRAKTAGLTGAAQYGGQLESGVASAKLKALQDAARGEGDLEAALSANRLAGLTGALKGETDLTSTRAGIMRGASADAVSGETAFQNALTSNRLAGLTGAGELELGLGKEQNATTATGLKGITDTNYGAQDLRQRGLISGAEGLTGIAQARAQADLQRATIAASGGGGGGGGGSSSSADDLAWARFTAGNEQYIGQLMQSGNADALRNFTSMYGMDPTLGRDNLGLDVISQNAANNRGLLAAQSAVIKPPTNWAGLINAGAGMLGGIGGGGGGGGGMGAGAGSSFDYLNYGRANPDYDFGNTGTPGGMGNPGDPYYIPPQR